VLAGAISGKRFMAIAGRGAEIAEGHRIVEHHQLDCRALSACAAPSEGDPRETLSELNRTPPPPFACP
jgi:hypothetical protein